MKESLQKKVDRAIKLLQSVAKGNDEYIEVAYSGGKDSDVILNLARQAGIKIRPVYHNTTIDPPGTLTHVTEVGGVQIERPDRSFFQLIEQMGMPNRFKRFCCRYLKEIKTYNKSIIGIRKAESTKRNLAYNEPTQCKYYGAKKEENHVEAIYPILDWADEDVLEFVKAEGIRLHPLYYHEDGSIDIKCRLGCMCCPLTYYKKRILQFKKYPGMVRAYCRAAQIFLETHPNVETVGKYTDVYQWFCREVFFERQDRWEKWLADNKTSFFGIHDYRQFLMDYFKVNYL